MPMRMWQNAYIWTMSVVRKNWKKFGLDNSKYRRIEQAVSKYFQDLYTEQDLRQALGTMGLTDASVNKIVNTAKTKYTAYSDREAVVSQEFREAAKQEISRLAKELKNKKKK